MENELWVWVMALVVYMTGIEVCGGLVPSIVVGRRVPGGVEADTADDVCRLVWVPGITELGVTEEVENSGSGVERGV